MSASEPAAKQLEPPQLGHGTAKSNIVDAQTKVATNLPPPEEAISTLPASQPIPTAIASCSPIPTPATGKRSPRSTEAPTSCFHGTMFGVPRSFL